jgi:Fe-S cluster assembly protein SufD
MITEITDNKNSFAEAFQALQSRRPDVPWLTQLRESGMSRFAELGFPTTKDEEWKYTNVAPLVRAGFAYPSDGAPPASTEEDLAGFSIAESQNSQLVFVNGRMSEGLSSLMGVPDVVALDLSQAIANEQFSEIIRERLGRQADYITNSFTALNTAFAGEGAFVYVPKGVTVAKPLHLLFITDTTSLTQAAFPRVLVVAEEHSNVTVIESYVGPNDMPYFTNAVVEVVLKDEARVEHYKVQREGGRAFHVATTAADLGRNSRYDSTAITFGAQLSRHDIHVTMDHEGVECWVDGLYLVTSAQHTDTHSVIDHRKPHCTSHQLYKGILDGKSRAVFNGKIFVRHDAQKTDAMQTNKNLLLSNEARVDTKPQLEILADDVKCAHGAAVGQIEEDELFYLETRGIHPDLGRNLLTYGFAEEVIGKIKIESIRSQLDEILLHRLNARLEA